jgi:hypothetical protein
MMNLPAEKHLNHLSSGQTHELTLNLILDRDIKCWKTAAHGQFTGRQQFPGL